MPTLFKPQVHGGEYSPVADLFIHSRGRTVPDEVPDGRTKDAFCEYCLYLREGGTWVPTMWIGDKGRHLTRYTFIEISKYLETHTEVLVDLIYYGKGGPEIGHETLARSVFTVKDIQSTIVGYPQCYIPTGKSDKVLIGFAKALLDDQRPAYIKDTTKLSDLPL